jgi:hypothetical protein
MSASLTHTIGPYEHREAAADLSALQYHFVKLDSAGKIVACSTVGEKAFGILQDKPKSGEIGTVLIQPGNLTLLVVGGAMMLSRRRSPQPDSANIATT